MDKVMIDLGNAFRKATEILNWRYNGGWTKLVTGIDKTKDNGYSLLGEFTSKVDQQAYQQTGVYLDCNITGSRKNQRKTYRLFRLNPDGEIEFLTSQSGTPDWAVQMWPEIEAALAAQTQPIETGKRQQLEAEAEKLRNRLAEIEKELASI